MLKYSWETSARWNFSLRKFNLSVPTSPHVQITRITDIKILPHLQKIIISGEITGETTGDCPQTYIPFQNNKIPIEGITWQGKREEF